ncbi:DUF3858 domain-containing protein [Winogradskyella sp. A3E31]|uniref:DUF3858 domain-containing protein n=1 Tax=Winogradskyella sp. A3E31 TaxID=3349637 RepID=UPI00398BA109
MKKLLLLLTFIFNSISWAQEYSPGFKVSRADLTNMTYSKDTTASAVVIYDYGNVFFNKESFWLNVEIKKKIKVLTVDGLDRATIEIPIYVGKNPKENIKDIRGTTYTLENNEVTTTSLTKSGIFEESNEDFNIVKLTLPNVKVGSVFTFSYTKSTRYSNKYYPWYFQGQDPVIYSEFNTSIPGNYEYNIKLVGGIPLDEEVTDIEYHCLEAGAGASANCANTKYVMKNIPAYKPEAYTTTSSNYLSRIEYERSVIRRFDGSVDKISKSWSDVDDELKGDKDFGRVINRKALVKNILPESITSITETLEKAKAIYSFVIDNYKWNNEYGRYDVDIKRLIDDKGGSAFELNIFLENLLYIEDIEVYPILTSTRNNGFITKVYPVLTDFNYILIKAIIDEKEYLLDATDPYLTFGEIPYRTLNHYGRLFDFETASYWEDINAKNYGVQQFLTKLELNEDNKLSGVATHKLASYPSHRKKRHYDENPELYLEKLKNEYEFIEIKSHKILNPDENSGFFEEELEVVVDEEFVGDKIFFNPILFRFFEENPFKLQERTYPIDFGYKQVYSYGLEIDLNDKLEVVELPQSINIGLPNNTGSFTFSIKEENNTIRAFMRLRFNEPIYNSEYYPYLKEFMNKVIETQNNKVIVLKRL